MFAKLLVIAGPDRGKRFEVVPAVPLVMGRSREADARLSDPRVSPIHCKLSVQNATLFIMDMDSLTGTSVNNIFVTVEYPLQLGDTFTVGDTIVLVQDPDARTRRRWQAEARPGERRRRPRNRTSPAPSRRRPRSRRRATRPARPDRTADRPRTVPLPRRARCSPAAGPGFVFQAQRSEGTIEPSRSRSCRPRSPRTSAAVAQFTKSMKLAMPLRHPNVVPVLGAGKTGPYCWMAMELVNGESLTATVRHIGVAGSLDWRRALRMSIHLSRGLTFLHEQKVVYRNIGPQNILCDGEAKIPRLSDFLRARPSSTGRAGTARRDCRTPCCFTPPRSRPREETEIDYRSDIFNLGALCYSLLTGRPPFEGGSLAETITKIRREKPEDPKKYQLAIPKAFEGVVMQMLAKRPEDRYQTTAEVLRDLERVLKYQGMTL